MDVDMAQGRFIRLLQACCAALLCNADLPCQCGKGKTFFYHITLQCRFTRLMQGAPPAAQQAKLQGLYMWGGVGVGKTMLMDLLAHSAPSSFQVRRLTHMWGGMRHTCGEVLGWARLCS